MAGEMKVEELLGGNLVSRHASPGTPESGADNSDESQSGDTSGSDERRGAEALGDDQAGDQGQGGTDDGDQSSAGDEGKSQGGDIGDLPDWVQRKLEDSEEKRRGFQSAMSRAEDDARIARNALAQANQTGQADAYDDDILNLLENKEDADIMEVGDIRKILNAQLDRGDRDKERQRVESHNAKIQSSLDSKKDLQNVSDHFLSKSLSKNSDSQSMTKLGNYYMGLADMLQVQLDQQTTDHKTALTKAVTDAEERGKKNANRPPVAGGNAQSGGTESLSKLEQRLRQRAIKRGLDPDTGERVRK